ncbi:hypothetical protein [Arthrobacter sp. UYCu712]
MLTSPIRVTPAAAVNVDSTYSVSMATVRRDKGYADRFSNQTGRTTVVAY